MHYSLTRATAWNLTGYLYLILASLISVPILVRSLGVDLFGQYSLIIATLALVSSFNLGLPQAVVRSLSRHHANFAKRQAIWATSSFLFVMTGLIGAVIAAIVAYYLHVSYTALPIVFGLGLMHNLVAHYLTLPHAEGHFGYFNTKTFIVGTGNTLLAAYLAWIGQGITAILAAQLFSYLVTLLPLVFFSLKYFPKPWQNKPSRSVAKSLVAFGLKSQAGSIIGQVQSQYGKYLLAGLSPLSLSAYIVAQGIVQKLVGGVVQVATAIYPSAARASLTSGISRTYLRVQLYLFFTGCVAVVLYDYFGLPFLTWWLGDLALVQTVHAFLLVYRFYGLLLLLTPLASTVLDGLGYPGTTTLFGGLAFAIELLAAVILYPRFGILAPAYAGIIGLGIMVPVLLLFTQKTLSRGGTAAH